MSVQLSDERGVVPHPADGGLPHPRSGQGGTPSQVWMGGGAPSQVGTGGYPIQSWLLGGGGTPSSPGQGGTARCIIKGKELLSFNNCKISSNVSAEVVMSKVKSLQITLNYLELVQNKFNCHAPEKGDFLQLYE